MDKNKQDTVVSYLTWSKLLPIALTVSVAVFASFGYLTSNHSHNNYVTVREMDSVIKSIQEIGADIREIRNQIVSLNDRK